MLLLAHSSSDRPGGENNATTVSCAHGEIRSISIIEYNYSDAGINHHPTYRTLQFGMPSHMHDLSSHEPNAHRCYALQAAVAWATIAALTVFLDMQGPTGWQRLLPPCYRHGEVRLSCTPVQHQQIHKHGLTTV